MLKNFENFTPDEIYHLENAIILSTFAHVSAITEFYKKLKFETGSAKAKKSFKVLKNFLNPEMNQIIYKL